MTEKDNNYFLPVILGPTAAGKTELSLKISEKISSEIISADSMQIYKDMNIGTAKVSRNIRRKIPHHMLDIITPNKEFSVAEYQKNVDKLIPSIYHKKHLPLLVGGTGLYIQAVTEGFLLPEMDKNKDLRNTLYELAQEKGNKYVHSILAKIDPALANKLHHNDLRRIIRGIEIFKETGNTKTFYLKKQDQKSSRYTTLKYGLYREREELYDRINKRVDKMIDDNLIEEVKNLCEKYCLSKTARQALGYKEIISYLQGELDLQEAVRLIKRNTRHFAKKQLTWFRKDKNIIWFNLSHNNIDKISRKCIKKINDKLNRKKVYT